MTFSSLLLVLAQTVLLLTIAASGPLLPRGWPLAAIIAGLALGLWSVRSMLGSKLRIQPEPHSEARLITQGPYSLIRHPMYSAVLMVAAGWVGGQPAVWRLVAWILLVAILLMKSTREERLWSERHPEYRDYMTRTKRLIPFLF